MTCKELERIAAKQREPNIPSERQINICTATSCLFSHSEKLKTAVELEVQRRGLQHSCRVKGVGCMGLCSAGPLISVGTQMLHHVMPADAPAVVDCLEGKRQTRLALDTTIPFFTEQKRIVLENCGQVDPESIEDAIAHGAYESLAACLTQTPQEVIDQVTRSGLRGRGGAGYPTGLKWTTVAKASGARGKFVICNADEGDPGAFMDRSVLEGDPHRVLEGMAIAAFAVGADRGFVYVRAEYPLAVKRLEIAIRQAEELGLLGHNLCDTRFSFRLEVRVGAGAYVCGEETALIASIEGKRGMPRPRPPYPAQSGLWGRPTLINNVETFANIPWIIRHGGDSFAAIGTEKSKGTKVFALSGHINNVGVIEVPMGIPLRDIVFRLGGGIPGGRKFKAAQTGGPSGGCVPLQFLDMPVDYESLISVGSMMGSGGMIVMDDSTCMVDVARFFMDFCRSESCGKCVPCRVGTSHMHELLRKITNGEAEQDDIALLERLGDLIRNTSLCGLGQAAASPVFSTLRYFRNEYEAHIRDKVCQAGSCANKTVGVGA
jgi:bidirectional [NiFe] hydrogenase diaphorase subunit